MTRRNKQTTLYSHQRALWFLVGVIVIAGGFYMYAINETVRNVVERRDLQGEVATLQSEIGDLEFTYIEQKNAITMDTAEQFGFRKAQQPSYVRPTAFGHRSGDSENRI